MDGYKYFRKIKSNHGFREIRERQHESRNDAPTFTPHMPVPACLHLLDGQYKEEYEINFFPNECISEELFFQADERVWEVRL